MWENLEETSETQAEAFGHGKLSPEGQRNHDACLAILRRGVPKMNTMTKVRIEIGGAYTADSKTAVYELTPEQYDTYSAAETAFNKARVARDKALGEPVRYPVGVCNFWIPNVRLTKDGNQYIKAGREGDLNVIETSTDRKIIIALFYPADSTGFGEVKLPEFERLIPFAVKKIR